MGTYAVTVMTLQARITVMQEEIKTRHAGAALLKGSMHLVNLHSAGSLPDLSLCGKHQATEHCTREVEIGQANRHNDTMA